MKQSKHRETLYVLVQRTGKSANLCYAFGKSPSELWTLVVTEEWLGTGHTQKTLQAQGWRAKRVVIEV